MLFKPAWRVKSVSNAIGTQLAFNGAGVAVNDAPVFIFTRE